MSRSLTFRRTGFSTDNGNVLSVNGNQASARILRQGHRGEFAGVGISVVRKENFMKNVLSTLAAALWVLVVPGAANAQSTWNLGSSTCNASPTTYPTQNSAVCTGSVGTTTATMTAWGNTGSGSTFVQGTLGNYDPYGMGAYTGANESSYSYQHAFDNKTANCMSGSSATTGCGGSVEMMLIGFSQMTSLTSVGVVAFSDSDLSIYRWDGSGDPTLNNTSANAATGALSTGWTLVKSADADNQGTKYTNPNGGTTTKPAYQVDTGNTQVSSWWLISTYFGATSGYLQAGDDAFKILAFTGNACSNCGPKPSVPEPASLALVGAALLSALLVRRRGIGRR